MAARLLTVERLDDHWHGITGRASGDIPNGQFVVDSVVRGSPSEQAGVRAGDTIVEVDSRKIERALDLECALLGKSIGTKVPVTVKRDGQTRKLSLTIAARSPQPSSSVADDAWTALGLRLQTVPTSQFRQLSSRYRGGLKVVAVREDSPADRQGIRSGDVLVGMHIWETISMENVAYILRHASSGQIKFYILRGDETLYGHLTIAMRPR
jgi:serine protease Do